MFAEVGKLEFPDLAFVSYNAAAMFDLCSRR